MAWTIQLKSSRLLTYDQWYLNGHFPLVIWQPEGMAAGQGEMQAEVHCKVQMVWHLNKLPGAMSSLKDVNSEDLDSFLLNGWAISKKGMPTVHLDNACSTSVEVDYSAYTVVVGNAMGGWSLFSPVIAPCCPN